MNSLVSKYLEFESVIISRIQIILKKTLTSVNGQKTIQSVLNQLKWNVCYNKEDFSLYNLSRLITVYLFDKLTILRMKSMSSSEFHKISSDLTYMISIKDFSSFSTYLTNTWSSIYNESTYFTILAPEFALYKVISYLLSDIKILLEINKYLKRIGKEEIDSLVLPYLVDNFIPDYRKQTTGQVFTPLNVSRFLCQENIIKNSSQIIDPCCGSGILLLTALEQIISQSNKVVLLGIENDEFLADIAESALNFRLSLKNSKNVDVQIIRTDFFKCTPKNVLSYLKFHKTTILMNPPYTRHEKIPKDYKSAVINIIKQDLRTLDYSASFNLLSKRISFYIYFIIHATIFLKTDDTMGVIIPNSWLDVDYGRMIQNFLLRFYQIKSLVISEYERLIPSVDVNTVIVSLKRCNPTIPSIIYDIQFTSIIGEAGLKTLFTDKSLLENLNKRDKTIESNVIKSRILMNDNKWGKYFRAPYNYYLFHKILDLGNVELSEISVLKRGFTTGANDFFYLGKPGFSNKYFRSKWNPNTGDLILTVKDDQTIELFVEQLGSNSPNFVIEKEYWMHPIKKSNNYNWEISFTDPEGIKWIPNYLIKSPKNLHFINILEKDTQFVVLLVNNGSLLKPGILEYIKWGESWKPINGKPYYERSTCKTRSSWFELPSFNNNTFDFLCLMTINNRFIFFNNPLNLYFDARFYGIRLQKDFKTNYQILFLYLNSIFTFIQLELLGRVNLGEGGLDIKVYEYGLLKIPIKVLSVLNQDPRINKLFNDIFLYPIEPIIKINETSPVWKLSFKLNEILNIENNIVSDLLIDFNKMVQNRLEKAKR
ncbi:N-6 DNA methylase [Candidatus Hodarchaeum mangrovi]